MVFWETILQENLFLINYNYISKIQSIYLNVKHLKAASEMKGFSDLLNNEIIILFKKLHLSFQYFKILFQNLCLIKIKD